MWEEITDLCRGASKSMSVHNSMISTSDFSLFHSMSAVELMDPKMDQCYQMTLSSVDTDDLMKITVPEMLTISMAVKILKILVVYESAFIDGASLLESTHQCILLWEGSWTTFPTQSLPQRALLAYCKSLNLSLNRLCHGISDADIFEGTKSS